MSNLSAEFNVAPLRDDYQLDFDNLGLSKSNKTRTSGSTGAKPSSTGSSCRTYTKGNHPNSLVTQESITVVIAKGNISEQMVDGLVNSVGGDMDLTTGAIAKSILQKAGQGIQTELQNKKPEKVHYGDVVVTGGYNLNAKWVFHGVLKGWHNGSDDSEQILRQFATSCLTEASKKGIESLAFPAIGTGLLSFPANLVATILFEVVDSFSSRNSGTSITQVKFVIYDKDQPVWNAFEAKMTELGQVSNTPSVSSNNDDSDMTPETLINNLKRRTTASWDEINSLSIRVPNTWSTPDPYDPYKRIQLKVTDKEYITVSQNVRKTCGSSMSNILKIERIENSQLYLLYQVAKTNVSKSSGTGVEIERQLWHGTAKDALNNIYAGGFNRSYCGKNATFYGKGVYFARDFSYSAQTTYSPADDDGKRYIFQCRVLTGHTINGTPEMIEPPFRIASRLRYDSVTNDVNDPAIFVIFKDNLAYPEYLVTFN